MARLQILELPEGADDDRPPFVLVVDQYVGVEVTPGITQQSRYAAYKGMADEIGARAVLIFEDTIDIPANEITLSNATDGNTVRIRVEPDLEGFRYAQGKVTRALDGMQLARERTNIARDMDRFAKWKNELTDALGMDRLRDWDDIRNAARGIRKQRDAQAEAIERVRNLHRPVEHNGQTICWACSAYDFPGQTTDSAPVAHDQCGTLRALAGEQEQR